VVVYGVVSLKCHMGGGLLELLPQTSCFGHLVSLLH
jgi:hypothetical protein